MTLDDEVRLGLKLCADQTDREPVLRRFTGGWLGLTRSDRFERVSDVVQSIGDQSVDARGWKPGREFDHEQEFRSQALLPLI